MYIPDYQFRPEAAKRFIRLGDGTVLAPRADLRGKNLSGMDLSFADLRESLLDGANFNDADLTGANLNGSSIEDGKFRRAILTDTSLAHANLNRTDFKDAIIGGANFNGSSLEHAILDGVTTVTEDYRLNKGTNFRNCDMSYASLVSATIESGCFERSDLYDANMEGAHIYASNIESCYLIRANFKNSKISDCFLHDAHMEGSADFSGASIYACHLEDIDGEPILKGAELKYCFFGSNDYGLFVSAENSGNVIDCVLDGNFIVDFDILSAFVTDLGLDPTDMGLPPDYRTSGRGPEFIQRPYDKAIKNANLVKSIIESLELAVCDMTGVQRKKNSGETISRAAVNAPELEDRILGMAFEAIELCIKIIDEEE